MAGEHGTYSSYVIQRCRCEACRLANRDYARDRARRLAVERWNPQLSRFVDAQPCRDHLRALSASGMGWKRAAQAAGLGCSTVYPILYGKYLDDPSHPEHRPPRARVRRDIAERILAVTPDLADKALVNALATRRRLRALIGVGWPQARLARELGMDASHLGRIVHGKTNAVSWIQVSTEAAVAALYERAWSAPPPIANHWEAGAVTRAQQYALEQAWPLPLDYDDDRIADRYYCPRRSAATPPAGHQVA